MSAEGQRAILNNALRGRNRAIDNLKQEINWLSSKRNRTGYWANRPDWEFSASDEIELSALKQRLAQLLGAAGSSGGARIGPARSTTTPRDQQRAAERAQDAAAKQRTEDERWLATTGQRPPSGRGLNGPQELKKWEAEYQKRASRAQKAQLEELQRQSAIETARVNIDTRGRERESLIEQRELRSQMTKEQRAAADQLSQIIDSIDDNEIKANIRGLTRQLTQGVSPEAIIKQAEAMAGEARLRRQEKRELIAEARASRVQMQKAAQDHSREMQLIRQEFAASQAKDRYVQQNEQRINRMIEISSARIDRLEGMIEAASGMPGQESLVRDLRVALNGEQGVVDGLLQMRTDAGMGGGAGAVEYTENNPAQPTTQSEYDALPDGSIYIDPDDGQLYRK
jgi:hypothetical protein